MTTAKKPCEDAQAVPAVGIPLDRRVRRQVVHKQVYRRGPFGGTLNTTICGRTRAGRDINNDGDGEAVTCLMCLRRMTPNG